MKNGKIQTWDLLEVDARRDAATYQSWARRQQMIQLGKAKLDPTSKLRVVTSQIK